MGTRARKAAMTAALALAPVWALAQNAPVAQSALPPSVDEMPLDMPSAGAAGLLTPRMTGLPVDLWQASAPDTLADLIAAVELPVPAARALMRVLMLTEALPPDGTRDGIDHLTNRIDWLTEQGAVEEALALLDITGTQDPRLFERWADLNLLLGRTEPVCRLLAAQPMLSTDFALRIFCTARGGDWEQAALLLQTGEALGQVSSRQAELLWHFLDSDLSEASAPLTPPVRPTPLEFRLFEALGEPLPTAPLPLEFSVLDLGGDTGWRAQLEAAERLARAGSLPANRLLGLYSQRQPAASGGVWDRVAAFQDFEEALGRGNGVLSQRLQALWPQMASARLLVPFAQLYADALSQSRLEGRAARIATRAAFLSDRYEDLAQGARDRDAETRFLTAIARGEAPEGGTDLPHSEAVARAFSGAAMPDVLRAQLDERRLGEVILRALGLLASGAEGNGQDLTDALATLRGVGLEDAARRAALQLMILDAERAL